MVIITVNNEYIDLDNELTHKYSENINKLSAIISDKDNEIKKLNKKLNKLQAYKNQLLRNINGIFGYKNQIEELKQQQLYKEDFKKIANTSFSSKAHTSFTTWELKDNSKYDKLPRKENNHE